MTRAGLNGNALERYFHACAFFTEPAEADASLIPFVEEGLQQGEQAIHITSPQHRSDHVQRLERNGLDAAGLQASGRLKVLNWEDAYLRGGRFSPAEMLTLLARVIAESRTAGYARTRIIGHMEWALEDVPGVDGLLEYEARVNHVLAEERQLGVCAYDLNRFGAARMVDVLRTHPMVVIGGTLYENPFFVPPDQFLQELQERAGKTADA